MTAALGITSGTVNAPGLKFNSEAGSGLYLVGTGQVGISIASATGFTFTAPSTANGGGILGLAGAVLLPVGTIHDYAGTAAPTGWLLCYGQEVSQSTYTQLYSVIGTAWGTASTATAFIIPDLRGRALFGKDDMGGSAANRVTNAVSGIAGATLGAVGGTQSITITQASLPAVAPTFTGTPQTVSISQAVLTSSGVQGQSGAGGFLGNTITPTVSMTPSGTISNLGSGTALGSMNPTAIVNKIIFVGHG
jgi:microcystin-dependent protein